MSQYEKWFDSKDSIYQTGGNGIDYRIRDITMAKNKRDFFNSIQDIKVVLSYPQVTMVQIEFEQESLFLEVGFFKKDDYCDDDETCHCEDSIIDEDYKELKEENNYKNWEFVISLICNSEGYSIDIERNWGYLILPASVKDKDGYINVRSERSANSDVVRTIKEGNVIFYTPTSNSNWWMVYSSHMENDFIGYVYKSRILTYANCSPNIKRKIEHEMH